MSVNRQNGLKLQKRVDQSNIKNMEVREFMSKDIISITDDITIVEAIHLMKDKQVGGLPIVSKDGMLEGIISEYDLLIQAGSKDLSNKITFTGKVITVYPDTLLKDLLILFYKNKLKRIPVVTLKRKLVGMVSRIDLLDKIAS